MVYVEVGNAKTAQEHFRILQSMTPPSSMVYPLIGDILQQLDEARPSGVDGKHGNLHTANCGCYIEPEEPKEDAPGWHVYGTLAGISGVTIIGERHSTYAAAVAARAALDPAHWPATSTYIGSASLVSQATEAKSERLVVERNIYRNAIGEVERTRWDDNTITHRYRERMWDKSEGNYTEWRDGKGEFG